ncbi:hypothetical protein [Haloparvum sp. AD34]
MDRPLGLASFRKQTRGEHVAVVLLAGIACAVAYVGAAVLLFGLGALDHGVDRTARRIAGAFASIACWSVFAVAFTRGTGGPVLNAVVYPVFTVGLVPLLVRWAVFGPNLAGIRRRFEFALFRPGLLVDAAALLAPGLLAFASILSIWGALQGDEAIQRWQREHLDPEFYDRFVDVGDDGGDVDDDV